MIQRRDVLASRKGHKSKLRLAVWNQCSGYVARQTSQNQILRYVMTGHFYFTKLLLPLLIATAKKAPTDTVRVINVSSLGHYLGVPEGIRWSTLVPGPESFEARRKLGTARLFGQSKTVGSTSFLPI